MWNGEKEKKLVNNKWTGTRTNGMVTHMQEDGPWPTGA